MTLQLALTTLDLHTDSIPDTIFFKALNLRGRKKRDRPCRIDDQKSISNPSILFYRVPRLIQTKTLSKIFPTIITNSNILKAHISPHHPSLDIVKRNALLYSKPCLPQPELYGSLFLQCSDLPQLRQFKQWVEEYPLTNQLKTPYASQNPISLLDMKKRHQSQYVSQKQLGNQISEYLLHYSKLESEAKKRILQNLAKPDSEGWRTVVEARYNRANRARGQRGHSFKAMTLDSLVAQEKAKAHMNKITDTSFYQFQHREKATRRQKLRKVVEMNQKSRMKSLFNDLL